MPPRSARPKARRRVGLNLFWRTFLLLVALLLGSTVAWFQTFRALEYEPRALQTAHQLAALVNLSRAALVYSDAITRVSLIKTMAEQEGIRILPREPSDRFQPFARGALERRMAAELEARLGQGTLVADQVNGEAGLWVGFQIEGDPYWMLIDPARVAPLGGRTWLIWLASATALSLIGAALIAGRIIQPLKGFARKSQARPQACDVGSAVGNALFLYDQRLRNENVSVQRGEMAGVQAWCDPNRLEQVSRLRLDGLWQLVPERLPEGQDDQHREGREDGGRQGPP